MAISSLVGDFCHPCLPRTKKPPDPLKEDCRTNGTWNICTCFISDRFCGLSGSGLFVFLCVSFFVLFFILKFPSKSGGFFFLDPFSSWGFHPKAVVFSSWIYMLAVKDREMNGTWRLLVRKLLPVSPLAQRVLRRCFHILSFESSANNRSSELAVSQVGCEKSTFSARRSSACGLLSSIFLHTLWLPSWRGSNLMYCLLSLVTFPALLSSLAFKIRTQIRLLSGQDRLTEGGNNLIYFLLSLVTFPALMSSLAFKFCVFFCLSLLSSDSIVLVSFFVDITGCCKNLFYFFMFSWFKSVLCVSCLFCSVCLCFSLWGLSCRFWQAWFFGCFSLQ